jgi:hypothetical protein
VFRDIQDSHVVFKHLIAEFPQQYAKMADLAKRQTQIFRDTFANVHQFIKDQIVKVLY